MSTHLHNRVLKLNVGFLLNDGPGNSRNMMLDMPDVRVSDDLDITYVKGPLRLSRTKEGILVQAELKIGIRDECSRCLEIIERELDIEMEELFAYHSAAEAEFRIGDDAILDLGPLLRAETIIEATSHPAICPDGCDASVAQYFAGGDGAANADDIDPRLAALRKLLDSD